MGYSLEVRALGVEIEHRRIFSEVSFTVSEGSLCQLKGPNGSGKSTLMLALVGLFEEFSGQVLWSENGHLLGAALAKENMLFISTRLGLTPQLTVAENLQWSAALEGMDATGQHLIEILGRVGLSPRWLRRPVSTLSSGQQQRLKLAKLFLTQRPIWLLDEPFTALDTEAVLWVEQALLEHVAERGLVIYASHHLSNCLKPQVVVSLGQAHGASA